MPRFVLVALFLTPLLARAGVHYSQESTAELPSQWRGFLIDQRSLRFISIPPKPGESSNSFREQYEAAAKRLLEAPKPRTAENAADLGAIYIRLGQPARALEVLREATRSFPDDYKIASNLGTAWQLSGDLPAAARALEEAVRLAPARYKSTEALQLRLVRERLKEAKNSTSPDNLFEVSFKGADGKGLSAADRARLPRDAVATLQQLALWLPADGRLLWQLGELANAHGDVRMAASILEGCVTEFAMTTAEIRQRRQHFREQADLVSKLPDSEHAKYRGDITFKSIRPLARKLESLPAIRPTGVNLLPWSVVAETVIEKPFVPRYHKHLEQLDGKTVTLTGYMQPVSMDIEVSGFMLIEYPIGCWFCETPEPTGIIFVELDKSVGVKRTRIKVEGKLKLNKADPEDFVYTITGAKVTDPD